MQNKLINSSDIVLFIQSVLLVRKLSEPTGQPLFSYHLTYEEYIQLKNFLKINKNHIKYGKPDVLWCAAFTLFAAEWFRREYSKDWSWKPIFEQLGFDLGHEVRYIVQVGLEKFWKRSIIRFETSQHSNYLGSVFKEGGFPSNLLIESNNKYQQIFQKIVQRYGHYRSHHKEQLDILIEYYASSLPDAFRKQETRNLIADMIEQLTILVEQHQLDKVEYPAEYLNQHQPKWREVFPLPLHNDVATGFLNQLLHISSREYRQIKQNQQQLVCQHFIEVAKNNVVTELFLPKNLSIELNGASVTTVRADLILYEQEEAICSLGSGQFKSKPTGNKADLYIGAQTRLIERRKIQHELRIVVQIKGQTIGHIELQQSSIDIGEIPLAFIVEEEHYKFIGQASFKTSYKELILLLPKGFEILTPESVIGHKADLLKQATYIVKGDIELENIEGEKYYIQCSKYNEQSELVELQGKKIPWTTNPALTYIGIPKTSYLDAGLRSKNAALKIFIDKQPLIQLQGSAVYGVHYLSVKNIHQNIVLRKKICILPDDFQIKLLSGNKPTEGIVRIITNSPCICLRMETDGRIINYKKEKLTIAMHNVHGYDYHIIGLQYPPEIIRITLMVSAVAVPVDIDVPFPAQGAILFDKDKKPFTYRQVTIDDLLGSRLHLFSVAEQPKKYQMELILQATDITSYQSPYYRWIYTVNEQPLILSLMSYQEEIYELLSLSGSLDAKVVLSIHSDAQKLLCFDIKHYRAELEKINDNEYILSDVDLKYQDKMFPVVMCLTQPEQLPLDLKLLTSEDIATGRYFLPNLKDNSEPWLIIPKNQDALRFRPTFVTINVKEKAEIFLGQPRTLHSAVRAFHPRNRPHVIQEYLCKLSDDLQDSGWLYLYYLYRNYKYLPLRTFQVWNDLSKNYTCLAQTIWILLDFDVTFLKRFEQELGVVWELIPILDWRKAIQNKTQFIQRQGFDEKMTKNLLLQTYEKLAMLMPTCFSEELKKFYFSGIKPSQFSCDMVKSCCNIYRQDLLSDQIDGEWPIFFQTELIVWYRKYQSVLPMELNIPHQYQSSVMILPIYLAFSALNQSERLLSRNFSYIDFYQIRQLRDFDAEWFKIMYLLTLTYFINQQD